METQATNTTPILEVAWRRHTDLSVAADRRTAAFYQIRRWIIVLGILATLFAIVIELYFSKQPQLLGIIFKGLFVAVPVLASILASFATKFYSNGAWLVYRSGSEEIKKEIYFYRTIWQSDREHRNANLRDRLAKIQRQLFRTLNGEFALEGYDGPVPARYRPNDPNSDPGFTDLKGEEYYKFRLKEQLDWHSRKVNQRKEERRRMTIYILAAGGAGTVLASWGGPAGPLSIWVALTAAITAGLIGWQELRNLDAVIKNYSKVVLELTILSDHWTNLTPKERESDMEFYKMVRDCEAVLWSQNVEYIKSMQEALQEARLDEEARLINEATQRAVQSARDTQREMTDAAIEITQETLDESRKQVVETYKTTLGTLVEEASSELVQKELEAMGRAVTEMAEAAAQKATSLSEHLRHLAREYGNVDISRNTTKEELNAILSRYPKSSDVKG